MSSHVASQLEPWSELNGKVVMATGAAAGLGQNFCMDLAKAGCKIIAVARRLDRLKTLCDEINQFGSTLRALPIELDVSADGTSIEAAVKRA